MRLSRRCHVLLGPSRDVIRRSRGVRRRAAPVFRCLASHALDRVGVPGRVAPANAAALHRPSCGPRSDRFEPGGSCHRHRVCPRTDATLAWIPLPARRDLRRDRNELRGLLGGGRRRRAVPVRARRHGDARRAPRADGAGLARLRADGRARAALRVPRARARTSPPPGLRCHPSKLLLDPYATAVEGEVDWDEAMFTYRFDDPDGAVNDLDSGPYMPKGVVTSPYFDWAHDRPPRTPWDETIVYEVHVKGFTQRHPGIPEELRGTYAGLAHPAALEYLQALGVTAVELLPVHQFVQDSHLIERGPAQLLGLQLDRVPRAAQRLQRVRPGGRPGAGVQADGQGDARGRARGDPRRRLQPHRRGQPPGPDAVVQGPGQPGVLPARRRRPALLLRHDGHRQQPQPAPSRTCCS